jgi:hypothetical protein
VTGDVTSAAIVTGDHNTVVQILAGVDTFFPDYTSRVPAFPDQSQGARGMSVDA